MKFTYSNDELPSMKTAIVIITKEDGTYFDVMLKNTNGDFYITDFSGGFLADISISKGFYWQYMCDVESELYKIYYGDTKSDI